MCMAFTSDSRAVLDSASNERGGVFRPRTHKGEAPERGQSHDDLPVFACESGSG